MTADSNTAPPLLFTPISLRGVTAKNRIVVSPMCQYNSVEGGPGDWQMAHLGRLAFGGAGMIFGEETAVEARGRKTYDCAGIWEDRHIPQYSRINDFIRQQGAVPAIQLGHAGRKASCHGATEDWRPLTDDDIKDGFAPWQGLAPSALDQLPRRFTPKEMDRDDIRTVLDAWREATRRSMDAGYDVVEVHGAHGYLIHQFLSPISNHRTDGYGGDLEGRMRFALEVAEVTREAWPADKPVFFRVSCVDGKGGIWGLEDTIELAKALKQRDIDLVDCSSGGITGDTDMPMVPRIVQFQAGFAERIRHEADIMTIAVGGITTAQEAETILQQGQADLVGVAREFIWNADWAAHCAKELGAPDPYGQMPHEYAYRLRLREKAKDMPINQGGAVTQAAYDRIFGAR
jgi:2,4-dienoyl-CoA reductase-like NADH-dependent reductase (Old Yellow Enzyme family)